MPGIGDFDRAGLRAENDRLRADNERLLAALLHLAGRKDEPWAANYAALVLKGYDGRALEGGKSSGRYPGDLERPTEKPR